jgi:predicted acyl esterase
MGGCLNAWDQLSWATTVDALAALPPDPSVRGREWRQCWLDRLEHAHPVIDHWLSHQRRDDYWRHGSVAEDPQAIRCAVYMVGGWADAYHDAILRFLARFQGPCKGLIGPWAHCYPHAGVPGPAIGFLQEAARWWDHWLKEKATGILDEPRLQAFMQEHAGPGAGYRDRPGRWIALSRWPSSSVAPHTYWLGDCCLDEETPASHTVKVRSPQSPAADRGAWCPGGFQLGAADFPPDQTAEDAQAASFTSPPLREEMPLLGFPTLTVQIAADRPRALMAARLCDVAPDGSSTLITRGVLNLCHRDGSDAPTVVTPGEFYEISLQLGSTGYVVPAGHRLRIAVSSTYWPWVWPSPEPVTLTIKTGIGTRLELPVLRPGPGVVTSVAFADHENGPSLATEPEGARDPGGRDLRRIAEDGVVEITDRLARGRERLVGRGVSYGAGGATTFRIREDAPLAAQIDCTRFFEIAGDGWSTKTQMTSTMSSTAEHFHLTSLLEAFDEDHRIFAKAWSGVIDRDCI